MRLLGWVGVVGSSLFFLEVGIVLTLFRLWKGGGRLDRDVLFQGGFV